MKPHFLLLLFLFGTVLGQNADNFDRDVIRRAFGIQIQGREKLLNDTDAQDTNAGNDSAIPIVQKFLDHMTKSIESKNTTIISELFQYGFKFEGCKGFYFKAQVLDFLSQIPSGTNISFALKTALDYGESINFTVWTTGLYLNESTVDLEFQLNKEKLKLESGVIPKCRRLVPARVIVERLLEKVHKVLYAKRIEMFVLLRYISETFWFIGCDRKYNDIGLFAAIRDYPSQIKIKLDKVEERGLIKFFVWVTGIGDLKVRAAFLMDRWRKKNMVQYGYVTHCGKVEDAETENGTNTFY